MGKSRDIGRGETGIYTHVFYHRDIVGESAVFAFDIERQVGCGSSSFIFCAADEVCEMLVEVRQDAGWRSADSETKKTVEDAKTITYFDG